MTPSLKKYWYSCTLLLLFSLLGSELTWSSGLFRSSRSRRTRSTVEPTPGGHGGGGIFSREFWEEQRATAGRRARSVARSFRAPLNQVREVVFRIPKDRCKAISINVGGLTFFGTQKGGYNQDRDKTGVKSNGEPCTYRRVSWPSSGSLTRDADYKTQSSNYEKGKYGDEPPMWAGYGDLQMHAINGFSDRMSIHQLEDITLTRGCIHVDRDTMAWFNDHVPSGTPYRIEYVDGAAI